MMIDGESIEVVDEYKYLGTIIDVKLLWNSNMDAIYKKGLLHKLRQFKVDIHISVLFYRH